MDVCYHRYRSAIKQTHMELPDIQLNCTENASKMLLIFKTETLKQNCISLQTFELGDNCIQNFHLGRYIN